MPFGVFHFHVLAGCLFREKYGPDLQRPYNHFALTCWCADSTLVLLSLPPNHVFAIMYLYFNFLVFLTLAELFFFVYRYCLFLIGLVGKIFSAFKSFSEEQVCGIFPSPKLGDRCSLSNFSFNGTQKHVRLKWGESWWADLELHLFEWSLLYNKSHRIVIFLQPCDENYLLLTDYAGALFFSFKIFRVQKPVWKLPYVGTVCFYPFWIIIIL